MSSNRSRTARRGGAPVSSRPAWLDNSLDYLRLHRVEATGVVLITLAMFSVASLLVPEGVLTRAWLGLLRTVFGWGLLAVPLALAALGLWLLLRKFQTRLPHVRPAQVVGSVVLYLGLLILLHAGLFPPNRAESMQLAEQGRGGGLLGAVMLSGLLGALGVAGTVVIMGAVASGGRDARRWMVDGGRRRVHRALAGACPADAC